MPSSRRLITSTTLSSSAASVTFSSIPSGYKDLVLRVSARTNNASFNDALAITFNNDSSSVYSYTQLIGTGGSVLNGRASNSTSLLAQYIDATDSTIDTFGSLEIYIPSYTSNTFKPLSNFGVQETNSSTTGAARMAATAMLFNKTNSISSMQIISSAAANFVSGSSFYLYGLFDS